MALKTGNKIYLSWDDVEKSVKDLCNKIRFDQPNIDSVHGIARGGLIPAVLLSHKLDLPYVNVVGPNTLVIDDICDSGVTLEKSPGVYTAVLHYKPHTSCFQPNMWADIHEGDEWLIYPWETKDSKPIQDYLANGAKERRDELEEFYKSEDEFSHLADGNYIGGLTMPKENTNMVGKKMEEFKFNKHK